MFKTALAIACIGTSAVAISAPRAGCGCEEHLNRLFSSFAQDEAKRDPKHQSELDRDIEMGKKYAAYVEENMKASEKADYIERVGRIGGELAKIANQHQPQVSWGDKRLNPFEYQFKVLAGDDINAFSLPGGFIYVYEGLVDYTESDHELAGVLGHEIAHASLRHIATLHREQNKHSLLTIPAILVLILSGGKSGAELVALGQLVGMAKGSGWSQDAENAADFAGFQYLSKSTYNPAGLLTFMERLVHDERNRPNIDWGIWRTHPPSKERAERLAKYLTEADIPVKRSTLTSSFRTHVKPQEDGGVEVWFNGRKIYTFSGSEAKVRAESAAERLDVFFDEVPDLFEVRGQSDGKVMGRRKVLIEVTPEDAEANGVAVGELATTTEQNIKGALFMLGYRIWSRR